MATKMINPRVVRLLPGHRVTPAGPDPSTGFWALGAFVAFVVAGALVVGPSHIRVQFVSGAGALAAFFMAHFRRLADAKRGAVRVGSSGSLQFLPRVWLGSFEALGGALGLLVYAVQVHVSGIPSGQGSVYLHGILAVSFYVVGRFVFNLGRRAGLTVSSEGLRGVRGVATLDVTWDDVVGFEAERTSSRHQFLGMRIDFAVAEPLMVRAEHLGSDPAVVAAILTYYLEHPEDRHLLADGLAAIRRVEEAFASSRRGIERD